jgi:NADPH:quinone reductase-like Zn-dependent oxidoreductase
VTVKTTAEITKTATETMRAVVWDRYGAPKDVLEVREIPKPRPGDDEVLVRVRAASVNPYDWHYYRGDPWMIRVMPGVARAKESQRLGSDLAGEVVAIGVDVTGFRVGERVYGGVDLGSFAEYVAVPANRLAPMPTNMTFEEAAAVPMGAITAMASLRAGGFEPGQSVIVNGASGGIGIFAVQLAKALGASEVTGVCSTRNVAMVQMLGADSVVDYTREDYSRIGKRYDLFIETQYSKPFLRSRHALKRRGTFAFAGGGGGKLLGPGGPMLGAQLLSIFVPQRVAPVTASGYRALLVEITALIEAGKVRSVIDATYPLDRIVDAMKHLETGHVSGKVAITI